MMLENCIKELARRPDEGFSPTSFLKARSLSNDGEGCMIGP
jgi:hypothetical protein